MSAVEVSERDREGGVQSKGKGVGEKASELSLTLTPGSPWTPGDPGSPGSPYKQISTQVSFPNPNNPTSQLRTGRNLTLTPCQDWYLHHSPVTFCPGGPKFPTPPGGPCGPWKRKKSHFRGCGGLAESPAGRQGPGAMGLLLVSVMGLGFTV